MLDRLRTLAIFSKVAELGSFRAAAHALGLSPSVVSHHVAQLEHHLQVPLLYRSTRRISLTPDGERLFPAAREMLEAAERGLDTIGGRGQGAAGALRVTVPAFLAGTDFCRELADFSVANPRLELRLDFSDKPRDLLREGFDLAMRIDRLRDSTHRMRKLAEMRRSLVASPSYARRRQQPLSAADLASWDFVQLTSRPSSVVLHQLRGKRPVTVSLTPRITVDSVLALRQFALAGAGLASLPELLVREDLARGRLVEILPDWSLESVPIYALWPDSAQRPTATLLLVHFLAVRVPLLFGGFGGAGQAPDRA